MSIENAKLFLNDLISDEKSKEKILTILKETSKKDEFNEKIAKLANDRGYDCTVEEIVEASRDEFKDISEDSLGKVSGGSMFSLTSNVSDMACMVIKRLSK
jgi:predicted ribosomally synthesized peptide with nif11-like leader